MLSTPSEAGSDIQSQRAYYDRFNNQLAEHMRALYPVSVRNVVIGGIRAETVVPREGISDKNRHRVLINLHGGAFMWGEGSGGEVESIPIASLGRIEVISVSYRLAPENVFPAASEDVAAVYRALIKTYRPQDIGIYGCSAGGVLTAEAIAWFNKVHLPMPGAIGTFCGSASDLGGDSAYMGPALTETAAKPMVGQLMSIPYFRNADPDSPLVFPIKSASLLAKFPPTLLLAGSRDFSLSSLFRTDDALSNAGVATEMHVWDGMWYAFFIHPDLPESQQVYRIIVRFFDRHLGVR
jgi:epsilon-lactone hydrolase